MKTIRQFGEFGSADDNLSYVAKLIAVTEREIYMVQGEEKLLIELFAAYLITGGERVQETLAARCEWLKDFLAERGAVIKLPQTARAVISREKKVLDGMLGEYRKLLEEIGDQVPAASNQGFPSESETEREVVPKNTVRLGERSDEKGNHRFWRAIFRVFFRGATAPEKAGGEPADQTTAAGDGKPESNERNERRRRLTATIREMEELYANWDYIVFQEIKDRVAQKLGEIKSEAVAYDWLEHLPADLYEAEIRQKINQVLSLWRETAQRADRLSFHHNQLEEERHAIKKAAAESGANNDLRADSKERERKHRERYPD